MIEHNAKHARHENPGVHPKRACALATGLAAGILSCAHAAAQPTAGDDPSFSDAPSTPAVEPTPDLARMARPDVGFFVDSTFRLSYGAEIDDANGEIDVARLGAGAGVSFRLNDTTDLILRMGSELSFYDFDNAGGVIPGMPGVTEPWDSVHQATITSILRSTPQTGWQWTIGGRVTSAGEGGADFGDTLVGGGFALASYDISPNFRIGAGINAVTRLEGGVFLFPIPVIQWDVTDSFRIGTAERGFGATYTFNQKWRAGVQVAFMRREYRLDDGNAVPEGSFTDIRVPVTLAVTYTPSPRVMLTGRVGSEVWGDLEINDRNENEIASYDLSSSVMVGFDLRIAF